MKAQHKITNLIASFDQLIEQLKHSLGLEESYPEATSTLRQFCPNTNEISKFQVFSEERYTRNLVHRCDLFEILLLCWLPGQTSTVHNHRNSWCGMKTLSGTATEIRFEESLSGTWVPTQVSRAPQHRVMSAFDNDMHLVGNFENNNLTTLHCYSPPLADFDIIPYSQTFFEPMSKSYATIYPSDAAN